jgi:hypothetical protein
MTCFSEEYADQSYEFEEQVLAGRPVEYVAARNACRGRKERLDHRKFPVCAIREGQIIGLFHDRRGDDGTSVLAEQSPACQ